MRTEISWTFKSVNPKSVIWTFVIVRHVNLISESFDANAYVSLVKNTAKCINISGCLVYGQANYFSSPILGIPDEFKAKNQTIAGFGSLFWWVTINKNLDWINYIYYNLQIYKLYKGCNKGNCRTVRCHK